jgi:hypothetical protein
MSSRIVIIGKGEFANALAQSLAGATTAVSNKVLTLEQVSSTKFCSSMSPDARAQLLADAAYVMYCGRHLSEHAVAIADSLVRAKALSQGRSLLEFMDWSNPDPTKESYDGLCMLSEKLEGSGLTVWKVTGLSALDVAGHKGNQTAVVYTNSDATAVPALDIPGVVWKAADKNTVFAEVVDRLITRSELDRWYDASLLAAVVWLTGFVYAVTRYTEWFNGSYPWTMIPLYLSDKGFGWAALWMMSCAPFAGNLLSISTVFSSADANGFDKAIAALGAAIMAVPVFLFILPWLAWIVLRSALTSFNKGGSSIQTMLVDMVSLRTETGIISFFFLFTHAFMANLILSYKGKWINADTGKYYGYMEISLACGVLAMTCVTILTIRSFIKEGSWMKLQPLYTYVSPLAIFLATMHLVAMGYTGWDSLFDPDSHRGQPSPNFTASMFSLFVLGTHLILSVVGTKKRSRNMGPVLKHSATQTAFDKLSTLRGGKAYVKAF